MNKKLNVLNNIVDNNFYHPTNNIIYLDNNATTIVSPDALDEMIKMCITLYGNPSSIHEFGNDTLDIVDKNRNFVANFFGCNNKNVIFTSGGTESINSAINSVVTDINQTFVTVKTEHNATLKKFYNLPLNINTVILDVDCNGQIDLNKFYELFKYKHTTDSRITFVSIMAANNETGVIHSNIDEIIRISHKYNALVHVDAVQLAGKLCLKKYIDYGADFVSISGHKFHAPKGIGALYVRNTEKYKPLLYGGSQNYGLRAGTENVAGIVALGNVCNSFSAMSCEIRDYFIKILKDNINGIVIHGEGVDRAPNTISVGFKNLNANVLVNLLSMHGVYVSIGSACHKGIVESHVLSAMNVDNNIMRGTLRISTSKFTSIDEINLAMNVISDMVTMARKISEYAL